MIDSIDTNGATVRTTTGLVAGTSSGRDGVRVFRGIPFGASTAGAHRWRPPQPITPWDGVLIADRFGDVCPQSQPLPGQTMSEDCLSLNVWSPESAAAIPRAVYVWIYGGRFTSGSGSDPLYDGAALAARDLVVVTFNYRTGVFGFLATPLLSAESEDGSIGNYGLLDQIAALQWVQNNISAFGGDPRRITIGGQSAGAASVLHLMSSPKAKGLIHGAIAESGALDPRDPGLAYLASSYRSRQQAEDEGTAWMAEHRVSSLSQMRDLPVELLLMGNDADEPGGGHRPPLFRPTLDGVVIPRTYEAGLQVGAFADVPVLTGSNRDEDGASPNPDVTLQQFVRDAWRRYGALAAEFLHLYPAHDDASARAQSNAAARDRSRVSTWRWASLFRTHANSPVFTYFWTHPAPGPDVATRGAFHGAEIPYFLDTLDEVDRPWTELDRRISDRTARFVAAFIKTGSPGDADWLAASDASATTMELGDRSGQIAIAPPARLEFQLRFLATRDQAR